MVLAASYDAPWRSLARLLVLLVLAGPAVAQTAPTAYPGQVSGRVLSAATGQPVPFADVLVLRVPDSTLVVATQTGLDGAFQANKLVLGEYRLRVQALNFTSLRRGIVLTAQAPTLDLGRLLLPASATQLAEVTVTAEKAVVEQQLGKTVINVEKDLSSVGGTAVDVLQNVPSVAVDATGTVSLRGSSNLTILLDGKPTSVSNGGTGPRLDQLPASRIAQIEVLTNPSARYDASGAGVINIITKKSAPEGWDGQVALVAGTGGKYAPSLHVSRHHGKATFTLDYTGLDQVYRTHSTSTQTAWLPDGSRLLTTQDGTGSDHNRTPTLGLGLRYELTPTQRFSLNVSPEWDSYVRTLGQDLTQQTDGSPTVLQQQGQQRYNVSIHSFAVTGDYRRTWAAHQGRELTASFSTSPNWVTSPLSQLLTGGAAPGGFAQDQRATVFFNSAQADYVQPSADGKGRLETGVKLDASFISGSSATLVLGPATGGSLAPKPDLSFAFDYTQLIPAAYASYQRQLARGWNVQGGLRTEYTNATGGVSDSRGSTNQHYLSWFPSAAVARELGKEPGQSRLQLSYSRRVNRPGYFQLLPQRLYQDVRDYQTGNPTIRPEFSHSLELGHQLNLASGASLTSTVFAHFTQDAIQFVRTIDTLTTRLSAAGIVTAETYQNVGSTANIGLELSWAQPLAKWWRVQASGSLYRAQIATNAGNEANRSALAGTARLVNNFTPRQGLDVQLTGSLRSTVLTAQGQQLATGGLDLALRQRVFGERAALTLRVSDLLNTQVRRTELATPELETTLRLKRETRVGWLGFTWYLGASKPGKRIEAAPPSGGFGS